MSLPSFPTREADEQERNAKLVRTAGRSGGPEQPAENAEKLPGCGALGYLTRSRRRLSRRSGRAARAAVSRMAACAGDGLKSATRRPDTLSFFSVVTTLQTVRTTDNRKRGPQGSGVIHNSKRWITRLVCR